MAHIRMWRRYGRFWGSDVLADVEAELCFHIDALTERLVQEGCDPAEAKAEAARRFGDYYRIEAACVDIGRRWERQRRWRKLVADLWQDLRIAARTLAKNPGFTISTVVVLGLGLGAATVMFSVINAVFVRPLPFPEPDRIVSVVRYQRSGPNLIHPPAAVAFLRDRSRAFSMLAGIGVSPGLNLVSDRGSTYIRNLEVTAGYFRVFDVAPLLGRAFSRDDETDPSAVLLSHGVWVGQFDGDPNIVGAEVRLGGRTHTVVGVMPSDFWSFEGADAWTPFRPDPRGADQNYRLIGRLAPGWSTARAEAELQALAVRLNAEIPNAEMPLSAELPDAPRGDVRVVVRPYRDLLAAENGGTVWPLAAAVGIMLLIVCANAAGLQVARAVGRRREFAMRAALGGGRGRLLRQFLTETVLLSTAGGAVGILAAAAAVQGLVVVQPQLAIWEVTVDTPVLFGSLGIAVSTGLAFGLLSGLLFVRSEPAEALHGGQSRGVTTARGSWMSRALVVAQVALCTVLLVAAGAFLRTFVGLTTSDLGFDPANVLTARALLQGPRYQSRGAVAALHERVLADLARLPGVEAAAVTNNLPVEFGLNLLMRQIPENVIVPAAIDWRYVAGDYLGVLRVPLVAGRAFGEADRRATGPPVAVVNEAFVRRFGGGQAVIGKRLQMTAIEVDDRVREIIGVLGDVRTRGVTATRPTVFVPVEQVPDDLLSAVHGFFQVNWALRTRDGGTGLVQSVERVIGEVDPLLSITAFRTMDEVVGGALAATRFRTMLLSLFAAAALMLSAAGLYGLVVYTVAQRTREIGIRLALGASSGRVTARFALQGIALAVLGAAVGVGVSAIFTEVLQRMTPDAQPLDPWTVAGVVLVLGGVSVAAAVVPARRAGRVDPMLTLRAE